MLKEIITTLIISISTISSYAEEGMWLPSLIGETKLRDMKKKGLKLSAEELYSTQKKSLKDAIVFLGGCTGEVISQQGLFITNHHCGYSQIQSHSSVEKDYLTNGFWAMNKREELPCPGYTASFLISMSDVTKQILNSVTENMDQTQKHKKIVENIKKVTEDALKDKGNGYKASVEAMYYSNQYFLFVSKTYTDVRLVAAPPSAIGKFGGDTDNWMWPRHTGDFCIFRIYADKDNNPAGYSADNVPYIPEKSLVISTKGVKQDDFTFIYGYPGRTSEYLLSDAVEYIAYKSNPHKIALRSKRLDIMNSYQDKDPKVRIQYSAKNASVANAWKKWQGEAKGIVKLDAINKKIDLEKKFIDWAKGKKEFENIIPQMHQLYKIIEPYNFVTDYFNESYSAIEMFNYLLSFTQIRSEKDVISHKNGIDKYFKNYYKPIDIATAKAMMQSYVDNVPEEFQPQVLIENKKDISAWIENIYAKSIFTNKESVENLLNTANIKDITNAIESDIAVLVCKEFEKLYKDKINISEVSSAKKTINQLYSSYMKGLMMMQSDKTFYPDANSTIRIAYGKVDGFRPADGVYYNYNSTLEGIMQKDNPDIYDYNVPQKLRDLYQRKDYGRWEVNGTVPVAFIASNHTTGGNSGSPVLNGKGELVGINFDRCWESTMSDIIYDKDMCRNIAVDIRYVLFILDKFAGASYLIDEMNIDGRLK